ncbi:MAG: methyl-accepting chemotaxis protein [Methylophaga sp.]|nr:methyl-accepting chemotaxis protein [Methylophaga sp.]
MQMLAGLGIVGFIFLQGLIWFFQSSENVAYITAFFAIVGSVMLYALATYIANLGAMRAKTLVSGIQNIKKGDLSRPIVISGKSDFTWMAKELDSARINVADLVHTIVGGVAHLETATQNMTNISKKTADGVLTQQSEINQVASAMNTMAISVQNVARTAGDTAQAAQQADQEAQAGKQIVTEAMGAIDLLANEVEKASETLNSLEGDIGNIGAIVDVIRGITEQTNLLALNAAIEAARAGEHGRGFAVVADEVRTLAARTQDSTHEIEEMVSRLQSGASAAVQVMNEGRERAKTSVEKAESAGTALDSITTMITKMDEMSASIASAANEQSTVAEDINRGIVNISQVAEHTAEGAGETTSAAAEMAKLTAQLQEAAAKFKV